MKKEDLNNHIYILRDKAIIGAKPMNQKERQMLLVIGIISIVGGSSSFTGSILSKSFVGYIISSPLMVIGIILIYISVKAQ